MKVERIKLSQIKMVENSRGCADKNLASLMESIQQHGLEQPVGVNHEGNGTYTLVYGNRRVHACQKLGWTSIPAVLYTELDHKGLLVKNLIENIQRENVSPSEIGRICEQLEKDGYSVEEMSARLNMPVVNIKNMISLYKQLPIEFRNKVFFHKKGSSRKGRIPIDSASRIINMRSTQGLSKAIFAKLLEQSMTNELSSADIKIISLMMSEGATFDQGMNQLTQYKYYDVHALCYKDEINELSKKEGLSCRNYLMQILYGVYPPISKPTFVKGEKTKTIRRKK